MDRFWPKAYYYLALASIKLSSIQKAYYYLKQLQILDKDTQAYEREIILAIEKSCYGKNRTKTDLGKIKKDTYVIKRIEFEIITPASMFPKFQNFPLTLKDKKTPDIGLIECQIDLSLQPKLTTIQNFITDKTDPDELQELINSVEEPYTFSKDCGKITFYNSKLDDPNPPVKNSCLFLAARYQKHQLYQTLLKNEAECNDDEYNILRLYETVYTKSPFRQSYKDIKQAFDVATKNLMDIEEKFDNYVEKMSKNILELNTSIARQVDIKEN